MKHRELNSLPLKYAEELKQMMNNSDDFNLFEYKNVLIKDGSKEAVIYGEIYEGYLELPKYSSRILYGADAIIKDDSVIKNRYGNQVKWDYIETPSNQFHVITDIFNNIVLE